MVIATTLVAVATSLPDLVVRMTAIAKGHKEFLVGNVIGADILHVFVIVGGGGHAASGSRFTDSVYFSGPSFVRHVGFTGNVPDLHRYLGFEGVFSRWTGESFFVVVLVFWALM